LENKLTSFSVKEIYLRAILLYLANEDEVGADIALKKYKNNDPTFTQTRQCKLCESLIKNIK
jgi:hypothetical protein